MAGAMDLTGAAPVRLGLDAPSAHPGRIFDSASLDRDRAGAPRPPVASTYDAGPPLPTRRSLSTFRTL